VLATKRNKIKKLKKKKYSDFFRKNIKWTHIQGARGIDAGFIKLPPASAGIPISHFFISLMELRAI
jgi:hypothetical protein